MKPSDGPEILGKRTRSNSKVFQDENGSTTVIPLRTLSMNNKLSDDVNKRLQKVLEKKKPPF